MEQNQPVEEWGSDYLLVKDVQENDIVIVEEVVGFVMSFNKKKYQLKVSCNGMLHKLLNLNHKQYSMMFPIRAGDRYQVKRIELNGGTALNYTRL